MRVHLLAAALITIIQGGSTLAAPTAQRFCNPRFGFCVSVPTGLRALPPPDNGDGQSWQGAEGVKVRAWGSLAPGVLGLTTPRAYIDWLRKAQTAQGSRITYSFIGGDSVVQSGYTKAGQIFYRKTILRGGTEASVLVEYPPRIQAVWNTRTAQIAASLTSPDSH